MKSLPFYLLALLVRGESEVRLADIQLVGSSCPLLKEQLENVCSELTSTQYTTVKVSEAPKIITAVQNCVTAIGNSACGIHATVRLLMDKPDYCVTDAQDWLIMRPMIMSQADWSMIPRLNYLGSTPACSPIKVFVADGDHYSNPDCSSPYLGGATSLGGIYDQGIVDFDAARIGMTAETPVLMHLVSQNTQCTLGDLKPVLYYDYVYPTNMRDQGDTCPSSDCPACSTGGPVPTCPVDPTVSPGDSTTAAAPPITVPSTNTGASWTVTSAMLRGVDCATGHNDCAQYKKLEGTAGLSDQAFARWQQLIDACLSRSQGPDCALVSRVRGEWSESAMACSAGTVLDTSVVEGWNLETAVQVPLGEEDFQCGDWRIATTENEQAAASCKAEGDASTVDMSYWDGNATFAAASHAVIRKYTQVVSPDCYTNGLSLSAGPVVLRFSKVQY